MGNLTPNTATDPLLRQLFEEQERLNIPTSKLAAMANVEKRSLDHLRHPPPGKAKTARLDCVRGLATALGFAFPDQLQRLDQ